MSTSVPARGKFSTKLESLETRTLLSGSTQETVALPLASLREPSLNFTLASSNDTATVTATGTSFTPMTSAELTSALNNAQLGDTIVLQAGTTYVGQFTLPNKTTGSGWITITSSAVDQLPEGERVSPNDATNMPRIQSQGLNASALRTAAGAHHYNIVGIEFVGPANNTDLVTLIEMGNAGSAQNTVASVPHDINIDRCYMRPNTPNAQIRRAIALNSASTDITNSYITDIHQQGSDSQAIGGWNGTGPYNIINNYLEAASENIMFGGATASIPGAVPSDIVIRGNHMTKNLDWRHGTNGSNVFAVKNLFELKAGRRVLVEGNIMENCWTSGQTGVAIVLKLGNWGSSQQNVTEDVTIRNNIIRHANGGVALQGRDYAENSPDGLVRRLSFTNNIFDDINGKWGTSETGGGNFFLYMTHGPKDVTFDHNTMFNGYTPIEVDSNNETYKITNFKYKNNIVAHNAYGVRSTSGIGNITLNKYFTDAGHEFTKNILMGGNANSYSSRPGNYFPATWDAVGFVDKAAGDYRLAANSSYKNAGTDGKDLGADIGLVEEATAGAISGVWESTPSEPAAYQQDVSGLVSIEAEIHDGIIARGGKTWSEVLAGSYSGGKGLEVGPNTGSIVSNNPTDVAAQVDYRINFTQTGTHYIWIRGYAPSGADDSLHAGLDGDVAAVHMTGYSVTGKWSKKLTGGAIAAINVTSPGIHTLNLWMREDGLVVDKIVLTTSSSFSPSGTGPAISPRSEETSEIPSEAFQQAGDGTVSIEAENFQANTSQGTDDWNEISDGLFSGGSGVEVGPNDGSVILSNIATTSSRLDYRINFTQTGSYYLWLRGSAAGGSDDSLHAGLDGQVLVNHMTGFKTTPSWTKRVTGGAVIAINVSTIGVHTINLWMREDGLKLDKLVLTKSSSYVPGGNGPAQSSLA